MDVEILKEKNLEKKLEKEYPHILKSIENEGYNLDYPHYDRFYEIRFEDETVGFITTSRFDIVENYYAIDEAYIIPEYRGNDLMFNYLSSMMLIDNYRFFPRKPTKAFVKMLLKNNLAFELRPGYVVSYMKFIIDSDDVYKNKNIKKHYKKAENNKPYKANLFDMDLCSVMLRDPECYFLKNYDFFTCVLPRKYDLKKYNCRKKLKRVTEGYLNEKFYIWTSNEKTIENFIDEIDHKNVEILNIENILGSEEKLSDEFISHLESKNLSIEDGFKIRAHITEGLKSGQLSKTSYWQRAIFLLSNIDAVNWSVGEYDENIEECPFCKMPVSDYLKSCLKCGLSIRDIDFEEHAHKKYDKEVKKIIMGKLENIVSIEENDDMEDEKRFYNEYLLGYDYDEFIEYYNNKSSGEISEAAESFIEEKLNNALGSEDEIDEYVNYLYYHCNYEFDRGNLDDAFVYYAQMMMLIKNYHDDYDIMNSTHILDGITCYTKLLDSNHQFDFPKIFDKAINTFKIEKYNKDHDNSLFDLENLFSNR